MRARWLTAAATFLLLNGTRLTAAVKDAYHAVIGLAEGRIAEADIAAWLRANTEPAGNSS